MGIFIIVTAFTVMDAALIGFIDLYGFFFFLFLFFKRIKHLFHFSLALKFSTESKTKRSSKDLMQKSEKVHFPSLF